MRLIFRYTSSMERKDYMLTRQSNKRGTTLFCFSPPVMIATAIIELGFAVYSIWRYKRVKQPAFRTLAIFTLLFLALFQIAEYHICEGSALQNLFWTKFGLASITLLPALGLHLVETITKTKRLWWVGYVAALIYIGLFVFGNTIVQGGVCAGNYVIIYTAPVAFGTYYFVFLFLALGVGWSALRRQSGMAPAERDALRWLMLGYFAFMAPMAAVYLLAPSTHPGGPSIMCGFAVMLALILGLKVLPIYYRTDKITQRETAQL